jgi:hypothetical protein
LCGPLNICLFPFTLPLGIEAGPYNFFGLVWEAGHSVLQKEVSSVKISLFRTENKESEILTSWSEKLTLSIHKFENYDLKKSII